jgi:pectinesterase
MITTTRTIVMVGCWAAILLCVGRGQGADATVAPNGDGQFQSIQDAIMAAPQGLPSAARPWIIHVKPGVYKELIYVQRERQFIHLEGEDAKTTVITFNLNANLTGLDGKPIGTFRTPTAQIDGDGFAAENITFENTAGPVGQALALRVDGDRVSFRNCRFLGWQDTMLLNRGRQYFEDCYITGHVDFIFGAATAFFDHCHIHCLRDGYITAASTPEKSALWIHLRQLQDHGRGGRENVFGPTVARLCVHGVHQHGNGRGCAARRLAPLDRA